MRKLTRFLKLTQFHTKIYLDTKRFRRVKILLNKQNKIHVKEGKMGNRFKGKKDLSNKMAIKNA